MRKFILSITFMLFACVGLTYAQAVFKKYGFNKAPLTLSNGKYNEFFTNDKVVQIGTVKLNTRINQIVEFLEEDTTKANYKSEFSSRWLSVDQLSEKYPGYSPYVYCLNNPVLYIDPDGKQSMFGWSNGLTSKQTNAVVDAWQKADEQAGKNIIRFGTPIEDIFGIYSGKDFDGNSYNRALAAGFTLIAFIPELKMLKYFDRALDGLKAARTVNAGSINRMLLKLGMKAPYNEAFKVFEGTTKVDTKFVRVHGTDNKVGKWIMDEREILGLSPQQIKDKFSLPELPTKISDVIVPANTNIRTGVVAPIENWGKGGGIQVELLNEIPKNNFTNTRSL